MKILRTPDERFANLPGFSFAPHYADVGNGLRMHHLDEGAGDPILCVHGEPSWSYLYRKMIPALSRVGRVVAPDLIGFGRSDKPTEKSDYTYKLHYDALAALVERLDLRRATLVCQDWGGLLGLPVAAAAPERFARLVIMNTGLPTGEKPPTEGFKAWRAAAEKMADMDVGRVVQSGCATKLAPEVVAAYNAPFPDQTYKAGAHKFPLLVPIAPTDEAVPYMVAARERLRAWTKPALVMFSDRDPVTAGGEKSFLKMIPSAKDEPEIKIAGGGHFLQEDKGEEIAERIAEFIARRPV